MSDVRTAEEIRRDLATEEGRGGSKRLSPIGRLVADVAPLLAEVERLCNSLEACRNAGQSLQTERDDEYERADNLRHDLRQEIASANELHARLEAVRARAVAIMQSWNPGDPAYKAAQELYTLALSAAPEPSSLQEVLGLTDDQIAEQREQLAEAFAAIRESERRAAVDSQGVILGAAAPACDEPARNPCTCDRAKEGAAFHHPTCPSYIGDEPARCEHLGSGQHWSDGWCDQARGYPGPASGERADA